jgi:hypothetical protein
MNLRTAPIDDVCDALLDDSLSQQDRWAVDRRMVRDSSLARAVVIQQKIRESLAASYAVPDLDRLVQAVARQAEDIVDPEIGRGPAVVSQPTLAELSPESSGAGVFLRSAALLLVLCFVLWNVVPSVVDSVASGSPELTRRIESHLTEAVVLGVVGAAALAGSRRLIRGREGRFILEQAGLRLVLPAQTQEAIALYSDVGSLTLLLQMPSGVSAITVAKQTEVTRPVASTEIYRRSVGRWELFGAGETAAGLLSTIQLEPVRR